MTAAPWQRALVLTVAGLDVAAPSTDRPDVAAAVRLIRAAGIDAAAYARDCVAAERPWPAELPAELRAQLPSLAQFYAARTALVEALDVAPHATRTTRALTGDERRLLADRPPHFGRVE